jgi:hypothetical protein
MSEEMVAKLHAELVEIRDILARLQERVEQLLSQLEQEMGLGTSDSSNVSEKHNTDVGKL